jgi:ParB family transcriptional regulator, chromosome partitioning protein
MNERRLGKGLDSLISRTTASAARLAAVPAGQQVLEIPVGEVRPNPDQPRQVINESALEGLAASIRQFGVMQPIVVQRVGDDYQLVAGERRLRASRLAGKATVPALVVEATGTKSLELALIENIQRENLNALEEAAAYDALLAGAGLTHQALSERVGKSRAAVTNALRLLELPDGVKRLLHAGALSAGQARAVLAAGSPEHMLALAEAACRESLSVREVEKRAQQQAARGRKRHVAGTPKSRTAIRDYEEQLRLIFGTKVSINDVSGRGDVRMFFYSDKDRDRLVHLLITAGTLAAETAESA